MMKRFLGLSLIALTASACTPAVQGGVQAVPTATDISFQQLEQKVTADISTLSERVRRVERAMIRLDKRMQLLERNELSRAGGFDVPAMQQGQAQPMQQVPQQYPQAQNPMTMPQGSNLYGGAFRPMSYDSGANIPFNLQQGANAPFIGANSGGFQPVSYNSGPQSLSSDSITSSLQPAPAMRPQAQAMRQDEEVANRLSSLADESYDTAEADASVSIWTVQYGERKVWPDRKELAASRDVVEALRSGKGVTLFARGSDPSSKEFRERVKALSKYLSRVADLENVPIASMPAVHLDGDTIEIMAAK